MVDPTVELALIAAIDRNGAIGRDNGLPWRLPDDLKRFKALTLGKPLLMGRLTAESLGRSLPGRRNLVLTRGTSVPHDGMEPVASVDAALAMAAAAGAPELCVIGGGQVYDACLGRASRMHLTHIDTVVADADAFFPAFDPAAWQVLARQWHPADARHRYGFEFVDYQRA